MKTNPLISRLYRLFAILINHPIAVTLSISFYAFLLCIIAVLLSSCKTPAVITDNESHHTRDSNYHASIQRIETHDTIVIGVLPSPSRPSKSPLLRYFAAGGDACVPGHIAPQYPSPILRISDRKITIRDTVFILRTDTLLRTQTITQKERYIPPFYRFCTISFVTFVSFVTLTFSIHLLLRYLKIRSPSI